MGSQRPRRSTARIRLPPDLSARRRSPCRTRAPLRLRPRGRVPHPGPLGHAPAGRPQPPWPRGSRGTDAGAPPGRQFCARWIVASAISGRFPSPGQRAVTAPRCLDRADGRRGGGAGDRPEPVRYRLLAMPLRTSIGNQNDRPFSQTEPQFCPRLGLECWVEEYPRPTWSRVVQLRKPNPKTDQGFALHLPTSCIIRASRVANLERERSAEPFRPLTR
jgi:hypothetical protein